MTLERLEIITNMKLFSKFQGSIKNTERRNFCPGLPCKDHIVEDLDYVKSSENSQYQ